MRLSIEKFLQVAPFYSHAVVQPVPQHPSASPGKKPLPVSASPTPELCGVTGESAGDWFCAGVGVEVEVEVEVEFELFVCPESSEQADMSREETITIAQMPYGILIFLDCLYYVKYAAPNVSETLK